MADAKTLLFGYDFEMRRMDGIGRYVCELHKGLVKKHYKHEILQFDDIMRPLHVSRLPTLASHMAENRDLLHIMQPELGWFTSARAKVKMITWHDMMIFSRTRKDIVRRVYHNISGDMAYKNSDIIMCNSSKTMHDVKAHFGPDKDKKFFPISHGIGPKFLAQSPFDGERKDFFYVGAINYEHKNLAGILSAFKQISERSSTKLQLLHIFTKTYDARNIIAEKARSVGISTKSIILHHGASDEEIIKTSKRCVACLHLTMEEGQGLPILESMALGTPVIVLKNAKIPSEVERYAIKESEEGVVSTALKLIGEQRPAPKVAIKYAKSFTYERTVSEVIKVYKYASGLA